MKVYTDTAAFGPADRKLIAKDIEHIVVEVGGVTFTVAQDGKRRKALYIRNCCGDIVLKTDDTNSIVIEHCKSQ